MESPSCPLGGTGQPAWADLHFQQIQQAFEVAVDTLGACPDFGQLSGSKGLRYLTSLPVPVPQWIRGQGTLEPCLCGWAVFVCLGKWKKTLFPAGEQTQTWYFLWLRRCGLHWFFPHLGNSLFYWAKGPVCVGSSDYCVMSGVKIRQISRVFFSLCRVSFGEGGSCPP